MAKSKNRIGALSKSIGEGELGGISDEDLQRGYDVLAAMLSGDLDVMLGADESRNSLDAPSMLERGGAGDRGMWRNPEYAPRGLENKIRFMGGSPYPMSPGQSRARDITAGSAIATNVMDSGAIESIGGVISALRDAWRRRQGRMG